MRRAHERVRHASNVHLLAFESLQSESIRALHYGESKDIAKMAYSRMALIRRGLGAKPTNSNWYAGRGVQAADQQARKHQQQRRFEHGSAHRRLTTPLRTRNSERKAATARPGLEPEPCGYKRERVRAQGSSNPAAAEAVAGTSVGAWRLLPGRQSQHQLCSPHFAAAALIVERAGMPRDAAGR